MRIIGGELRRRRLESPPEGTITRPIPDRVKQSLFNLLRGHCEGATVYDGFAGTGSIGLEAVSRGAARLVAVERDRRVADVLERNATTLGVLDRVEIVRGDALGPLALARCPAGVKLVFFDPPYDMVRSPAQWPRVRDQFARLVERLADDGFAMLRTPWPFVHPEGGAAAEEPAASDPRRAPDPRPSRRRKPGRGDDRAWRQRAWDEAPGPRRAGRGDREGGVAPGGMSDGDEGEALDLNEPAEAGPTVPVSLEIEGAEGPETHVYRQTAVHLYMRRK